MARIPPREREQVLQRAHHEAFGAALASVGMVAFLIVLVVLIVVAAPH